MNKGSQVQGDAIVDGIEDKGSLEFPAVDSLQAENRAAFVAGFRDNGLVSQVKIQPDTQPDPPRDPLEKAFTNLSVSENAHSRSRSRGRGSVPPSTADGLYRPWSGSGVSYCVPDSYGPRLQPGQMPMQWMPYHPNMSFGVYGEQRPGFFYDARMQGSAAFQSPFPPQPLQSHVHRPLPGQAFTGPMMPGYFFPPHQQAPLVRQRPPRPSKAPQQPTEAYDFSVEEAEQEPDTCRKTLMLRNIPNKYSIHMLLEMLDTCHGKGPGELVYDFCYLPIDFKNRCNLGYAFVNFVDAESTLQCFKTFNEKRWNDFNSKKVCEVKYGRVQGYEALIEHFKNSKFPSNDIDSLPLLFEQVIKEDGSKEICSVPLHSRHSS